MATLQSTNVIGALCVNGVAVGGGKDFNYCCFTASTTFTPSSDLVSGEKFVEAIVVGAGGGGGGTFQLHCACTHGYGNTVNKTGTAQGEDGGAGQVAMNLPLSITSTDACTITIGAGGIGGYVYPNTTNIQCGPEDAGGSEDPATAGGDTCFGDGRVIAQGGGAGANCYKWKFNGNTSNHGNHEYTIGGDASAGYGTARSAACCEFLNSPNFTRGYNASTLESCINAGVYTRQFLTASDSSFKPYRLNADNEAHYDTFGAEYYAARGASVFTGYANAEANRSGSLTTWDDEFWFSGPQAFTFQSTISESFDSDAMGITASTSYISGSGGQAGRWCYRVCAQGAPSAQGGPASGSARGANGSDGLVVLRWYE